MTTETVKPADAETLRRAADFVTTESYGAIAVILPSRLRALADVLDKVTKIRHVEIRIYDDLSVSVTHLDTWQGDTEAEAAISALINHA